MTYRELLAQLARLTDEQLNCDVIVELGTADEFLPAELQIRGAEQNVLDENHPVIFVADF